MKKWLAVLVFLGLSFSSFAQVKFPQAQGWVNDFAGALNSSQRAKLTSLLEEVEKKTGAEVAVVVLDTTKPLDIQTYAVELFEKWGIGKRGKDNGLLLLVALKDRKMKIEVGYGLEGVIPDALAKQIIENIIVPQFKQGNYFQGIYQASSFIAASIAKEYGVKIEGAVAPSLKKITSRRNVSLGRIIFTLLFFILIFGTRGGIFWWFLLGGMPGGGWSRGDSSFGGGLGGFSGFGGGLSGGGGASGSW